MQFYSSRTKQTLRVFEILRFVFDSMWRHVATRFVAKKIVTATFFPPKRCVLCGPIESALCLGVLSKATSCAGVSIFAVHDNQQWTVLQKIRDCPFLMALGGHEDTNTSLHESVRQKTRGIVMINGLRETCGIIGAELLPVAEVLLGNKVLTRFVSHLDDTAFKRLLFHQANRQEDGSYKLTYSKHDETEYLLAVPVRPSNRWPFARVVQCILQSPKQHISVLTLLLDHAARRPDWVRWQSFGPYAVRSLAKGCRSTESKMTQIAIAHMTTQCTTQLANVQRHDHVRFSIHE